MFAATFFVLLDQHTPEIQPQSVALCFHSEQTILKIACKGLIPAI
jgi:hypothetical protein